MDPLHDNGTSGSPVAGPALDPSPSLGSRFKRDLGMGIKAGVQTFWALARVMIPAYGATLVLERLGVIEWLARAARPLMSLLGLPGDAAVPLDESVAAAVVDVGGRPYAVVALPFRGKRAGKLPLELIEHVLESFARAGGVTLNVKGRGRNAHHLAEAAFKALGRSLCAAVTVDPRRQGPASTKGTLG